MPINGLFGAAAPRIAEAAARRPSQAELDALKRQGLTLADWALDRASWEGGGSDSIQVPMPTQPAQPRGMIGGSAPKMRPAGIWDEAKSDPLTFFLGGTDGLDRKRRADEENQLRGILGTMEMSPLEGILATTNPALVAEQRYKTETAAKQKAAADTELMNIIGGFNLSPELLARARANPAGFLEEIGKGAGTTRGDTYQDPLTGKWNIKPQLGQNGDSLFLNTGDAPPTFWQRPQTYGEIETSRSNRAGERQAIIDADISRTNADTARINATKPPASGGGGGMPAGPSPYQPPSAPIGGQGYDPTQPLLHRTGIGADGRYAATEGDPGIVDGMPPPRFNTVEGLTAGTKGKMISDEDKLIQQIRTRAASAMTQKGLADKFITESDGFNSQGPGFFNDVGQWASSMIDGKVANLTRITNDLAPQKREAGSGAMSDKDVEMYKQSVVSVDNTPAGNAAFALQTNAMANRMSQYAQFMQNYRAQFGVGSLAEGQRYWDMFALANPVFDDSGNPVEDPMTYYEFFSGNAPPKNPYNRKVAGLQKGLSAEEQAELEQLRREVGR